MTTGPKTFRKRPVEVEAYLFTGDNGGSVVDWIGGEAKASLSVKLGRFAVLIDTLEGVMTASPGDWVIRGVQGEHYPCKPDIFEATYEPVESADLASRLNDLLAEFGVAPERRGPVCFASEIDPATLKGEEPWGPSTRFAVNLLDLDHHNHGATRYIRFGDAVTLFHVLHHQMLDEKESP